MFRVTGVARVGQRWCSTEAAKAAAPTAKAASDAASSSPAFKHVKFQKEEVSAVMEELPAFEFYEMNEPQAYPYAQTLDRSIVIDAPAAKPIGKPAAQLAKLENGLKVAAIDNGGLKASVGLFVNAGSRFESSANFGVSHMASLMAFKSTAHLSNLRTVKTLEQLGAANSSTCTAGREDIVYQVDVMREYVPLVVPLLVGNVLFPRLLPWEVKAAHAGVKQATDGLAANPDAMVNELLHKAAFCNNTLGFSPLASTRSMSYFTPETIRSFLLDHFSPERMVLVGVNTCPDELNKWAMRSFVDYNAIPHKERADSAAAYTGGDLRIDGPSPFCHVAVGLQSGALGAADHATVLVLKTLLGGGSAGKVSLGGGSLSRLSTQVVRQNPGVESCTAFQTSYSDTGVFGVYGVSHADAAGAMATGMMNSLAGLTSVSADELAAAKAVLKGNILREFDCDSTLMKHIGQQLLLTGNYTSPADAVNLVDAVTLESVTATANKLLSSSPTVAAYGDVHGLPHYAAFQAGLRA